MKVNTVFSAFKDFLHEKFDIREWINIQKASFEWPVAKDGYTISGDESKFLMPKSRDAIFGMVRSLDFQEYSKKLLFEHFRDINVKDEKSIIDFANRFGLLTGPECIMYEQRREINSISIGFFIREVRDFQEIFSLREHLSQSEAELITYFKEYCRKRFRSDGTNFGALCLEYMRMFDYYATAPLVSAFGVNIPIGGLNYETQKLLSKKLAIQSYVSTYSDKEGGADVSESDIAALIEEEIYYLNKEIPSSSQQNKSFSIFSHENGEYLIYDNIVTDLDFMDYPQKKKELNTKDLGYYYLEKWLDFKLKRKLELRHYSLTLQIASNDTESKGNTKKTADTPQPQSLLDAIYLQFYYSLFDHPSTAFCPVCLNHIDINGSQEYHHSKKKLGFYYHQDCIEKIRKKLGTEVKGKKLGIFKTIALASEKILDKLSDEVKDKGFSIFKNITRATKV
jgi:hypothetical protein